MSYTTNLPYLWPKQTAVVIRGILKRAFPGVKFSVKTNRGAGVSSVDVRWTDGPLARDVDALVNVFVAGTFNGMVDMYEYDRDHIITVDGVRYQPGTRYVFTRREISVDLARFAAGVVASYYRREAPRINDRGTWWDIATFAPPAPLSDWHTLIHRYLANPAEFTMTPPYAEAI